VSVNDKNAVTYKQVIHNLNLIWVCWRLSTELHRGTLLQFTRTVVIFSTLLYFC